MKVHAILIGSFMITFLSILLNDFLNILLNDLLQFNLLYEIFSKNFFSFYVISFANTICSLALLIDKIMSAWLYVKLAISLIVTFIFVFFILLQYVFILVLSFFKLAIFV